MRKLCAALIAAALAVVCPPPDRFAATPLHEGGFADPSYYMQETRDGGARQYFFRPYEIENPSWERPVGSHGWVRLWGNQALLTIDGQFAANLVAIQDGTAHIPGRGLTLALGEGAGYETRLTRNPIVWIDGHAEPQDAEALTEIMRGNLRRALKAAQASPHRDMQALANRVQSGMDSLTYLGAMGCYALFDAGFKFLYNTMTGEAYIVKPVPMNGEMIRKADFDDAGLYWTQ